MYYSSVGHTSSCNSPM